MFNKKRPYGEVHGTGVAGARYMQDGHAYDVDFQYCWSNPGMAPPKGVDKALTMEQAEREFQERQEAIARGEAVPRPKRVQDEKKTPPPPPAQTGELTHEQQLMQLNVPKLQEMQYDALKELNADQPEDKRKSEKDLRKDVIKGPGAKERLITWLLENVDTSDA